MYASGRQYLRQYRQIKRMIEVKKRSREMLIELSQLSGVDFTKSRVQSAPVKDQIGDIVARLESMDAEIARDIDKLLDVMKETEETIASIKSPIVREVLERRYLFGERWEAIAAVMGYSVRQVYRIHRVGLAYVDKMFESE